MEGDYEKQDEANDTASLPPKTPAPPMHYYGDIVRRVLFGVGILMIIGMPVFAAKINFSSFFLVLGILAVNLFAGFTNSDLPTSIWGDFFASLIGLVFFELIAYFEYAAFQTWFDIYFWFNQLIAISFFVSLYFSVKTLRGMLISTAKEDL